jgi:hypothetical protein
MTVKAHIETLRKRHGALDARLASAKTSPSTDDSEVSSIKREKLRLKDEIARLENSASV